MAKKQRTGGASGKVGREHSGETHEFSLAGRSVFLLDYSSGGSSQKEFAVSGSVCGSQVGLQRRLWKAGITGFSIVLLVCALWREILKNPTCAGEIRG